MLCICLIVGLLGYGNMTAPGDQHLLLIHLFHTHVESQLSATAAEGNGALAANHWRGLLHLTPSIWGWEMRWWDVTGTWQKWKAVWHGVGQLDHWEVEMLIIFDGGLGCSSCSTTPWRSRGCCFPVSLPQSALGPSHLLCPPIMPVTSIGAFPVSWMFA